MQWLLAHLPGFPALLIRADCRLAFSVRIHNKSHKAGGLATVTNSLHLCLGNARGKALNNLGTGANYQLLQAVEGFKCVAAFIGLPWLLGVIQFVTRFVSETNWGEGWQIMHFVDAVASMIFGILSFISTFINFFLTTAATYQLQHQDKQLPVHLEGSLVVYLSILTTFLDAFSIILAFGIFYEVSRYD